MRKLVVGAGWKMNKTVREAKDYCSRLLSQLRAADMALVDIFVLPPFTALAEVAAALPDSDIKFGAQNMHWETRGAWTGEISPSMLHELGCSYVEIGHAERRRFFNETEETINRKVLAALEHQLMPILCIGEQSPTDREQNQSVLRAQLEVALAHVEPSQLLNILIAYEPQWAIGQPNAAAPDYIQTMHLFLRRHLASQFGAGSADSARLLYGGSVNLQNAETIVRQRDVDGLFIGRAALDPDDFLQFIALVVRVGQAKAKVTSQAWNG